MGTPQELMLADVVRLLGSSTLWSGQALKWHKLVQLLELVVGSIV